MAGSASGDFDSGELFANVPSVSEFSDGRPLESTSMPVPSAPLQAVQFSHEGRLVENVQPFVGGNRGIMHVGAHAPAGEGMSSNWRLFASMTQDVQESDLRGVGLSPQNRSTPHVQAYTGPRDMMGRGEGQASRPDFGQIEANTSIYPRSTFQPEISAAQGVVSQYARPSPSCV